LRPSLSYRCCPFSFFSLFAPSCFLCPFISAARLLYQDSLAGNHMISPLKLHKSSVNQPFFFSPPNFSDQMRRARSGSLLPDWVLEDPSPKLRVTCEQTPPRAFISYILTALSALSEEAPHPARKTDYPLPDSIASDPPFWFLSSTPITERLRLSARA